MIQYLFAYAVNLIVFLHVGPGVLLLLYNMLCFVLLIYFYGIIVSVYMTAGHETLFLNDWSLIDAMPSISVHRL